MSASNRLTVFRQVLLCFLACIFAWQTFKSMEVYLDGGTTFSTRILMKFRQNYPGLSLCPTTFGEDLLNSTNLTYKEELEKVSISFNIDYNLLFLNKEGKVSENDLGELWNITVTHDLYSNRLIKCYTFSPEQQFDNGYASLLNLVVYGDNLPSIFVHFHQHKDNLLVPTITSHRGYIILPNGEEGNRQVSYQIGHRLVKEIPKEQSPCDKDHNSDMHQCIESYIERQSGCVLPWRQRNDSTQNTCTDTISFKEMYVYLAMTARSDVFKLTGCKPSCTYTEYTPVKLHDRPLKNVTNSSLHMHQLILYLSPGEIPYVEEVYMYNFLDFVGNVGGFLGLLLGASLISLFDQALIASKKLRGCLWLK